MTQELLSNKTLE